MEVWHCTDSQTIPSLSHIQFKFSSLIIKFDYLNSTKYSDYCLGSEDESISDKWPNSNALDK